MKQIIFYTRNKMITRDRRKMLKTHLIFTCSKIRKDLLGQLTDKTTCLFTENTVSHLGYREKKKSKHIYKVEYSYTENKFFGEFTKNHFQQQVH